MHKSPAAPSSSNCEGDSQATAPPSQRDPPAPHQPGGASREAPGRDKRLPHAPERAPQRAQGSHGPSAAARGRWGAPGAGGGRSPASPSPSGPAHRRRWPTSRRRPGRRAPGHGHSHFRFRQRHFRRRAAKRGPAARRDPRTALSERRKNTVERLLNSPEGPGLRPHRETEPQPTEGG